MSDSTITQLMEVTGLDRHSATIILKINNNNLEEAINYHLEGGGGDGSGGGGGDNSSVSENASLPDFLPIDNERKLNYIDNDEIRAPIPPIREQLIQPEYDQFSYQYNNNINTRKRRLIPTKFTVCPFRNFAREAEQQEEQFINGGNGIGVGILNNNNERNYNKLEYNNITEYNNLNLNQRGLLTPSKRKRLEDLFRPPSDILFLGTFQSARDHATNLNRWLIVNLQDHHEFQSQILNRDIWPDKRIKEIILSHFILCQISLDNPEGIRFKTFYRVINLPYVCILDPRTGEDKLSCDTTSPSILYNQFIKFLDDNSYGLDPNDPPYNNLQQRHQKHQTNNSSLSTITGPSTSSTKIISKINQNELIDTIKNDTDNKQSICSNDNNIIINKKLNIKDNNIINNKQPLLELSEQDQLNLAIQNSLKEKRCKIISNKYYNSDDDDDDDDDDDVAAAAEDEYEYDVDEDNNTNDTNSDIDYNNLDNKNENNHKNNINNDIDYQKQKNYQQLYSKTIKKDIESYTNYLGNITDQLTKIQIRTPFGERECLEWPSSTLLRAIILYVQEKYPTITKNSYKLIAPYPKQNILELDNQLTLIDAKLYPSAILYLHPDD